MKIAIASDHGGFLLKEQLKDYVEAMGHQVKDLGCYSPDRADYPDHGIACGEAVAKGEADRGIVVCEHEQKLVLPEEFGRLKKAKTYKYGKIEVTVYRIPFGDDLSDDE